MDVKPRPSANPRLRRQGVRQHAAAWWGFHYKDLITEPKPREVITIYEIDATGAQLGQGRLQLPMDAADRSVRRGAQDHRLSRRAGRSQHHQGELRHPEERPHSDPAAFRRRSAWRRARPTSSIPIPPGYFGGNIDNWRIGKGATMYYPVAVAGACSRSAIRTRRKATPSCAARRSNARSPARSSSSCTRRRPRGTPLDELDYPLLETQDEWVLHGFSFANYLAGARPDGAADHLREIVGRSRAARRLPQDAPFLMTTKGLSEDEAISLMSVGVDFGVTQVVDGNWGVHAIIKKTLFAGGEA